jgi:hypothetical protein
MPSSALPCRPMSTEPAAIRRLPGAAALRLSGQHLFEIALRDAFDTRKS